MKNSKNVLLYLGLVVLGLLLGWWAFAPETLNTSSKIGTHKHEEAEQQTWTCSMHPQVRKNEPGNCPICGMELIPAKSASNGNGTVDPTAIAMSATARKLANVETAVVGRSQAIRSLRLEGKVQEDERRVFSVSSHFPGRVERLNVNFTGEFISKGQLLAMVYSPELVTAQEELFEARKIRKEQPALYKAAMDKLRNWKLEDDQIDLIKSANEPIEEFPVEADRSGYVVGKNVKQGDYIQEGTILYRVADLSKVWALFDVHESDLNWVNVGDKVQFTLPSLPGDMFSGRISYLDPVLNAQSRVVKARMTVANPDRKLKPEMFVRGMVKADLSKKGHSLTVPKSAVLWTGERSVVYVKQETEKGVYFKLREVLLGPDLGDRYVIQRGLHKGEAVAVQGTFSIDAAAQLAGKPSMMSKSGEAPPQKHNHGKGEVSTNGSSKDVQHQEGKGGHRMAILQKLIPPYLKLKNQLVLDKTSGSQNAFKELRLKWENIDLSAHRNSDKNAFESLKDEVLKITKMTNRQSIEELRANFKQLSALYRKLVNESLLPSRELYIQYCPMADDNKGAYWISGTKNIKNPYMGTKMISCGETVKTVSP